MGGGPQAFESDNNLGGGSINFYGGVASSSGAGTNNQMLYGGN